MNLDANQKQFMLKLQGLYHVPFLWHMWCRTNIESYREVWGDINIEKRQALMESIVDVRYKLLDVLALQEAV